MLNKQNHKSSKHKASSKIEHHVSAPAPAKEKHLTADEYIYLCISNYDFTGKDRKNNTLIAKDFIKRIKDEELYKEQSGLFAMYLVSWIDFTFSYMNENALTEEFTLETLRLLVGADERRYMDSMFKNALDLEYDRIEIENPDRPYIASRKIFVNDMYSELSWFNKCLYASFLCFPDSISQSSISFDSLEHPGTKISEIKIKDTDFPWNVPKEVGIYRLADVMSDEEFFDSIEEDEIDEDNETGTTD